jgi:hypothetical protein
MVNLFFLYVRLLSNHPTLPHKILAQTEAQTQTAYAFKGQLKSYDV